MIVFSFVAWVHPKSGGDDYQIKGKIDAHTLGEAKKILEEYLGETSDITTDYQIKED